MTATPRAPARWLRRLALPPGDLLRDAVYRRLWASILISSFGGQVTMLALPLTAAVLLQATPTQMGLLSAVEIAPFVLFSLPGGVWLDRVRKLPVYIAGELVLALIVVTVPLAWVLGRLTMEGLYLVGFAVGTVYTIAGSAAQIVLTQIVPRARLVEAHAKNALASSGAEVAGPGFAGVLIKAVGAPLALLVDALMLLASALILRGIRVFEPPRPRSALPFRRELATGLRFVAGQPLLRTLAVLLGGWQMCHYAALTVQILFATRTLGLSESTVGFAYVAIGGGTVLASAFGHAFTRRIGPGPSLLAGFALCGAGWLLVALLPAGPLGVAGFALMLFGFGVGAVLVFINFLALRQSVTPQPLLGRMTSTMRWLTLLPAGPGALLGGWLGDAFGLRSALAFAGGAALLLALAGWRRAELRGLRELPRLPDDGAAIGGEATVRPVGA
jgi:MFS family permease